MEIKMPENNEEELPAPRAEDCTDPCPLDLDVTQIVEIYNELNDVIKIELQDMYDCKKINGATYAQMWLQAAGGIIQSAVSGVIAFQTKETFWDRKLKEAQALVLAQDLLNKQATEDLTRRQIEGFDDNARQKLYEAQMNAWALMFSSGLLSDKPKHIEDQSAGVLYYDIKDKIDGTVSNPLGAWTRSLSATQVVGSISTASWGAVANATIYTLYVDDNNGALAGYPKTVNANGTEPVTIPTPPVDTSVRYSFRIDASDGQTSRTSTYSLLVNGPSS